MVENQLCPIHDGAASLACGYFVVHSPRKQILMPSPAAKVSANPQFLRVAVLFVAAVLPASLFYPTISEHTRAVSLLLQLKTPQKKTPAAEIGNYVVDESRTTLPSNRAPIPARIYRPRFATNAPGMVIVHGVH